MSDQNSLPTDHFSPHAPQDLQRQAAATVQDVFARLFRLSVDQAAADEQTAETLGTGLSNWVRAGGNDEARAIRLALVLSGLDQWGVAYAQAFELAAIPTLTQLLGDLRTQLNPEDDARFLQKFEALQAEEGNGIDFKIDLRRSIHLALWHAMVACDNREDALRILACLGGSLMNLTQSMPHLGWRLVADSLTHIQLRCLSEDGQKLVTDGLGQEMTQALFESLRQSLDQALFSQIMNLSARALMDWQAAKRAH